MCTYTNLRFQVYREKLPILVVEMEEGGCTEDIKGTLPQASILGAHWLLSLFLFFKQLRKFYTN